MSAATATATADAGAAPAKGKKKLIIIIVAAVLVLVLGGVGALLMLKKGAAVDDDDEADVPAAAAVSTRNPKSPPVFAPLEPFTVNLADREAERYAQVGITLEMVNQASADALKVFMPAVRNNILMLLAHKSSADLLDRDGKETLAREVKRETARGLGFEVAETEDDEEVSSNRKRKKRSAAPTLPITAVYFSTFIIQ